jgi:hypothetical protein
MSEASYFKVSYVVSGGEHPGAIISTDKKPVVGEKTIFAGKLFEITEVMELMPAVGDFGFLHVTCKYISDLVTGELPSLLDD